jgi:general secretion pathway protein C
MSFFNRGTQIINALNKGPKNRPPFEGFYIYFLALFAGYLISDLAILAVRPGMLPTQAPPTRPVAPPRQQTTSLSQYQKIRERNVFNMDGVIAPALTSDGKDSPGLDVPPVASSLPLKLEGTLVHVNPKKSVATVTGTKGKGEAKPYMVDQEIEGMARVTKVERRKLIFRNLNSQRLEFIEIPKDSAITFGVKNPTIADEEVKRSGEFDFTMRRNDINKYTANLGELLQKARMVPNIVPGSGGRVDGFKFVAIEPGSIYEKLGFKPMDVIKSVNGQAVNSPTQAMELYNALKSEGNVRLGVERDGHDDTFNYNIAE